MCGKLKQVLGTQFERTCTHYSTSRVGCEEVDHERTDVVTQKT